MDPRLGEQGKSEPQVCAVTGQAVRGRHAVTYSLSGDYMYRILSKAVHLRTDELHAELQAIVDGLNKPVEEAPKRKKAE